VGLFVVFLLPCRMMVLRVFASPDMIEAMTIHEKAQTKESSKKDLELPYVQYYYFVLYNGVVSLSSFLSSSPSASLTSSIVSVKKFLLV